jgi:YVTN family beta-propeller protein
MQSLFVRGTAPLAGGVVCALAIVGLLARPAAATFATFESGQVRPLAFSPDGTKLFAVNTPDDELEIFSVTGGSVSHVGSVPVGLEPVAVAARSNGEVWVVNHLSDSVSVVDVSSSTPHVTRTLLVGDEPRDIVFGGPTDVDGNFTRAFITTARRGQNLPPSVPPDFTTPGTPRALVWVFDATNLGATLEGTPITVIQLFGDTPRALAVTPDGQTVYAAIFQSGNETTAISEGAVCDGGSGAAACPIDGITVPGGLAGGQAPGGLPAPNQNFEGHPGPETGLVLKFNEGDGLWEDGLGRNWTNAVRFSLPDLDVFQIDAGAPTPAETASFAHVGTVLFNMLVNPSNGKLYVTNTDAQNNVRFEGPGTSASTVRGNLAEARITVIDGVNVLPRHLNKHITAQAMGYRTVPMPLTVKDASLATPVGMALSSTGTLYVAAFGSSAIGTFSASAVEDDSFTPDASTHIAVSGGGPTGLALDEAHQRLYVLTRFDNAVKVIDTGSNTEIAQHPLHNPEPAEVVTGRPFLYDAHFTSSNGEASCSSCHVFADFDSLGWDLGNPDAAVAPDFNPLGPVGSMQFFHPLKGPMTTQTLRGLVHHGPMHWRGDRTGAMFNGDPAALDSTLAFEAFNVAFDSLVGRDEGPISDADMAAFTQFILSIDEPPNPNRALDNVLTGQALSGHNIFFGATSDSVANCNGCHTLDPSQGFFGTGGLTTFENETQEFKVAHLNNAYQKVGMFGMPDVSQINVPAGDRAVQGDQIRGFGFLHDGSVPSIFDFLHAVVFSLTDSNRADLEQFVLAIDTTYAPIVGQQVTLTDTNAATVGSRIDLMIAQAEASFTLVGQPGAKACDLVVKGIVNGQARGYLMDGATGLFHSDRAAEMPKSDTDMRALATTPGQQLTYTCAPPGSGVRMGIDRDEDGFLDRDELDAGSDPADPLSVPGPSNLLTANKLLIKNKLPDDVTKNKVILMSKSASIVTPAPNGATDPRCNADPSGTVRATLTIASATSGQSLVVDLPCQNWKLLGSTTSPKGYKYSDPALADGPAKVVVWKNQKLLKATLFGKGPSGLNYDLQVGVGQGAVSAQFTSLGGDRFCMQCTGSAGKDGSDGRLFEGSNCPAPAACP